MSQKQSSIVLIVEGNISTIFKQLKEGEKMLPFFEVLDTQEEKNKLLLLYQCFAQQLYHVAFKMLDDERKAEDVVHETYMTMTTHLNCIDENVYKIIQEYIEQKNKTKNLAQYVKENKTKECGKAWNFIVTILKNKIYNLYIKDKREHFPGEEWFEQVMDERTNSIENSYETKEIYEALKKALRNLDSPYKDVLYLKYYNGMSTEEISSILQKKPENIRQIAVRGREKLKEQLRKGGYYEF